MSRFNAARPLALAAGLAAVAAGAAIAGAQAPQGGRPPAKTRTLWFFFAPSQKGLAEEAARLRDLLKAHPDLELRASVLVDDWSHIRKPCEELAHALKVLAAVVGPGFSLPLWDDEGLRMARELGVDRLPAYALVEHAPRGTGRHAHVAYGRGANLTELVRCK